LDKRMGTPISPRNGVRCGTAPLAP
jgi:hypothetical protein